MSDPCVGSRVEWCNPSGEDWIFSGKRGTVVELNPYRGSPSILVEWDGHSGTTAYLWPNPRIALVEEQQEAKAS